MRDITVSADDGIGLRANIARIGTKIFRYGFGFGPVNDLAVQNSLKLADIVAMGSNQNKPQRHTFFIHQKMPSTAVFFPCPLGFGQPHRRQSEP